MTLCTQWAWKPNDTMKSLQECLQSLVKSAAGNGNFLFNVGPMPDGRIEARQVTRLKEMGAWLNQYGESIYGTMGGPYVPNNDYATTRKGSKIYVHVFNHANKSIKLPKLSGRTVRKAYWLKGEKGVFRQNTGDLTINLPDTLPDVNDSVLVLELDGSAEDLPILKP
jgi:alpha-L-fucosidase